MTEIATKASIIPAPIRQEIDTWLQKYPPERKRSGVLYALRLVQEYNGGWLTTELMDAVADYLELPNIAVYEVVSFYSMFETKPVGKCRINVCNSISCMLRGSEEIIKHLENKLGIKAGTTSEDAKFTLKETECLAACINAPVMQINHRTYHENLTPEKIDEILASFDQGE